MLIVISFQLHPHDLAKAVFGPLLKKIRKTRRKRRRN
jgi:hypothetical protein